MTAVTFTIPELETERLRLRALSEKDFADEAAFYTTERSKGVGGPKRPDEVWRALASLVGHWVFRGYGMWAVEEKATGKYCGHVGPWFPEAWPEPEISWTVMQHAEGRGIAREAAIAARDFAYRQLGWTTAISLIGATNTRSQALAQRLGATLERDYLHPAFGAMGIWRHPGPKELQ